MDSDLLEKANQLDGQLALWGGPLDLAIEATCDRLDRDGFATELFERKPALWSDDAAVQQKIANRLGWLISPDAMVTETGRLAQFARAVRNEATTDVVLLGMGGSSLAPEVVRQVMGIAPGWPRFHMLDSTDPSAVGAIDPPLRTSLFIIASKSGGTIEPNCLAAHFRARLRQAGIEDWARHFVAITDRGTALHERALSEQFRDVFLNPTDIGGRYSAVSFFGLVPAALMGHDPRDLVDWARTMIRLCRPGRSLAINPAVRLGIAMAEGAKARRDKLTLLTSPRLDAFGLWAEQLIAESTGKQGQGVVPVAGERLGAPSVYGRDRVFVRMELRGDGHAGDRDSARALSEAGSPLIEIEVPAPAALFAEFIRWEVATAVAGMLLAVNPFDEPNVQQAKDMTRRLLDEHAGTGRLAFPADDGVFEGARLGLTAAARSGLASRGPLEALSLIGPDDYLAILAYLGPDPALARSLDRLRHTVRDSRACATTFGYGPRYLHSTGQLHKGGPNRGVFLLVTSEAAADVPIPGEPFTFATLEHAQAFGDFASLDSAGRRAVHIHLSRPDPSVLDGVCRRLAQAIPSQSAKPAR